MIKLKKTYIAMMMAAVLTACGHRAASTAGVDNAAEGEVEEGIVILGEDQPSDGEDQSSSDALTTDRVSDSRKDNMATVEISIDWPTAGNEALVESIRQYLCEQLATEPYGEGNPEVTQYSDAEEGVQSIVQKRYKDLRDMWQEAHNDGYGGDTPFDYLMHSTLNETGPKYVTYVTRHEGSQGGAHGYAISTGQTFRISDGLRIGYQSKYNQNTMQYEIQDQTLFDKTHSPKLHALIREGVRSYFLEFDEGMTDDQQLKDMLIGVEDINQIPLPSSPPHFTKDGLCFIYQQYEIAPYAAGMINFTIPYDKVRSLLSDEAQELIP